MPIPRFYSKNQMVFWGVKRFLIHGVIISGAVICIIPFLWMLSTSFKTPDEVLLFPPKWIPSEIQWGNYWEVFAQMPFLTFFKNSATVTLLGIVGQLLSSSLVAFGFARMRFPLRNALFILMLSTLMLPYAVTMIPVFIIFKYLGWLNTLKPLIVPAFFGNPFYIFLMRQFIMTVPAELDESAKIDGCNAFHIYYRIVLPLCKPVIATIIVFSFVFYWNDFMGPLIYLNDVEKYTVAIGLRLFQGQYGTFFHLLMAASTIALLPILILFFFAQRYFIEGIALTGLKG
ncbi:MAG: carbohydrate ABC transporter permease [bacterium]